MDMSRADPKDGDTVTRGDDDLTAWKTARLVALEMIVADAMVVCSCSIKFYILHAVTSAISIPVLIAKQRLFRGLISTQNN